MQNADLLGDRPAGTAVPVSEFVRQARGLLETRVPLGWVGGEVCNLTRAASGHLYFTLKDSDAQLRCAMWRNRAQLMAFRLEEGMQVEVRAQLTIYEARGDLQLSVESVRRAGIGNLYEAFLRLKAALEAAGLFDPDVKRGVPRLPRGVGVVTSLQAAALHDVLAALARRAPALPVCLYPAPVQGEGAAAAIAAAIAEASRRAIVDGIDALIVCRGGGSLEDLWSFNDEAVVRAIRACSVPVVSGVGHENDATLCDFAADLRAATPTAAAEAVSVGMVALRERLPVLEQRLARTMSEVLRQAWQRTDYAQRSLVHPRMRIQRTHVHLAQLAQRLQRAAAAQTSNRHGSLNQLTLRLGAARPSLERRRSRVERLAEKLSRAGQWRWRQHAASLDVLAGRLAAIDPHAVLRRGYAMVQRDGRLLSSVAGVTQGDEVTITFHDGKVGSRITSHLDSKD